MSRRSALIALFLAASVYSSPAGALITTAVLLAPWAAADLAHAFSRNGDTR
ncbi:hypothetical protein [Actinomadura geliboluensis]|uniref:hypothetical protein n=1 Tax=Actinomadura geliboluensis TaxID=882440 RepID=UPI0036D093A2